MEKISKKSIHRWLPVILLSFVILAVLALDASLPALPAQNEPELLPKKSEYAAISPQEAKQRLDSEKNIILLDVRTREEFEQLHIPNALLVPLDTLEKEIASQLPDKNTTILVYCRSGRRSAIAAQMLADKGYASVYDLGGIIDWPYETMP